MIFAPTFPWTPKDLQDLRECFQKSSDKDIQVKWFWEPFHRAGFQALKYAEATQMNPTDFQKELDDLSSPSVPPWLDKRRRKKIENEIHRLDPKVFIQKTYAEAQFKIGAFKDAVLPTISDLKKILDQERGVWEPVTKSIAEVTELSKSSTLSRANSEKFYSMKVWDQLEFLETMTGLINSSSVLNFTRIYSL